MFESLVQGYALNTAPSTVIPVGVSIEEAKKTYHLEHVDKLASNENPFGVSPKAQAAMTEALQSAHLYPDSTRDTLLKQMLSEKHGLRPDQIMLTCGAANALAFAGEVFLRPGTECIIPSPAYPPYYYSAFKSGAEIVDVPCQPDTMELDSAAILAAVTEKTRMIFLCNPHNPTSTALSGAKLLELVEKLPEHVIAVVDEAYIDFAADAPDTTMVPHLEKHPNMIVIQTFSKLYGLAGVRLGYAMACPEIIRYLSKTQAARSMSTIAIEGGIAALQDEAFRRKTVENNAEQRLRLTQELRQMGFRVCDSQANFLYVDFHMKPGDLYFALLPYGIMVRGDFSMVRISIGTPEQNSRLLDAVRDLIAKGALSARYSQE